MTPLEGARLMVRYGYAVFPLSAGTRLPAFKGSWKQLATRDPDRLLEWFDRPDPYNVGVSTEGTVGVDVDIKEGKPGLDTLLALGDLPETFTVRTGTGGLHLYYTHGDYGQSPLGPGVDVRSHGGYLVGPGSVVEGRAYEVVTDTAPVPVPPEISSRCAMSGERRERTDAAGLDLPSDIAAATAWLLQAPPAIEGMGGDAWTYSVACTVRDHGLSEPTALALMLSHWDPRCVPPWGPAELARKIGNAYAYAKSGGADRAAGVDFEGMVALENAPKPPTGPAGAPASIDVDRLRTLAGLMFHELDPERPEADIPPIPWVLHRRAARGMVTALAAPPGVGKSTLTVAWAAALALGDGSRCGLSVRGGPQRVVMINNEDRRDETEARIRALAKLHRLDLPAIMSRLRIYDHAGEPFVAVVRAPQGRALARSEMLFALEHACREFHADVVIADPLVEMHVADENDNAEMSQVMSVFRTMAHRLSAAVILVHHTRKIGGAADAAGSLDVLRGGGAIAGKVRFAFTLLGMSKEEAEQYGLSAAEARRHIRLDRAKGTYTPADASTEWYRHVSVTLANGEEYSALQPADLSEQQARVLDVLCEAVLPIVRDAPEGVPVGTVARRLMDDPLLGHESQTSLTRRLQTALAQPAEYAGWLLCVETDVSEGGRTSRRVKCYAKDDV